MRSSRVFWRRMRGGVGLALLAISCESASVGADAEFDQPIILTADAPVTAFEVTYCLNDEPTRSLSVYTRFSVSVRSEDSHVVTLERLTVEEGDDAADAEHSVDEIETKAEESVSGLVMGVDAVLITRLPAVA